MKSLLLVGLASTLCLSSAAAQTPLEIGRPHVGVLTVETPLMGEETLTRSRERTDCYSLDTQPGEQLTITVTLNGWLRVGRGADCNAQASWDTQDTGIGFFSVRSSTVTFGASGGTYLISAGHPGVGSYTITVNRSTGRPGPILPAGAPILRPLPGTASTAVNEVASRSAGETFRDCPSCPQMVVVPPASFMMGSPDDEEGRNTNEGPRHVVTIGSAFAIGTHEVTFDEYDACVADQACRAVQDAGWGRGRRPVINVRYQDAQRYVGWLSQKTGQRYFLPSEAEWEYAARAGSDTAWNTGSAIIASDANILGQFGKTVPVGSYPANAYGLFDTHGNVYEWTQDCMDTGYLGAPTNGSASTGGDCNSQAVLRGGFFGSLPAEVRSAARGLVSRLALGTGVGFRVIRAL